MNLWYTKFFCSFFSISRYSQHQQCTKNNIPYINIPPNYTIIAFFLTNFLPSMHWSFTWWLLLGLVCGCKGCWLLLFDMDFLTPFINGSCSAFTWRAFCCWFCLGLLLALGPWTFTLGFFTLALECNVCQRKVV